MQQPSDAREPETHGPGIRRRTPPRAPTLIGLVLLSVSCVADDAESRIARHGSGRIWRDAAVGVTESPWQWGAAATFAIAYPIAANNDSQWSASAIRDPLIGEPKKNGDLLLEGMMGASLGLAAYEWYSGDQGTATEVLLESAVLSAIIVESLKSTVRRQRPAGSNSNASFPSGHATTAFIAATMISRRIDDYYDGPTGYLGYLSYLPAAVVALNRVENGRHYPSDVIVGALLGTVLTNVIYNAHYGTGKSAGGLQARHERRYHLVPQLDGDYVGIGLEVRF